MGVNNVHGEQLHTVGSLSARELAGKIIDAYNEGKLNDLAGLDSVTLAVYPIQPPSQPTPTTIELKTYGMWNIEEWIDDLQAQGYDLSKMEDRHLIEVSLIEKIRTAFPDSYINNQSKLPRGYEWCRPD